MKALHLDPPASVNPLGKGKQRTTELSKEAEGNFCQKRYRLVHYEGSIKRRIRLSSILRTSHVYNSFQNEYLQQFYMQLRCKTQGSV